MSEETYEEWQKRVYSELPHTPTRLVFHTPPECAGQMVEVSYAQTADGHVIRWTHDRSSATDSYDIAFADERDEYDDDERDDGDEGDYWNGAPRGLDWGPLDADEIKRYWDV